MLSRFQYSQITQRACGAIHRLHHLRSRSMMAPFPVVRAAVLQQSCSFSQSPSEAQTTPAQVEDKIQDISSFSSAPSAPSNTLLFRGPQSFPIRAMLGSAAFNFMWWSYYMVDYIVNKDTLVNGESVVASPWFGAVGAGATVLILYTTRQYARNCVFEAYESADGQRIGFVAHNILGNPGRKFEVPIGNARVSETKVSSFTSNLMALRVDGIKYNILMDKDGEFFQGDRLQELLRAEKRNLTDTKEHRVAWKKSVTRTSTANSSSKVKN